MFKNVCLGGTFDGIHAGHRLLLGEATKICKERLVVGVTDDQMIRKKILWELITPYDERVKDLHQYLNELNSDLIYQIVPLKDLYGPTITDEDLDCIVVSEETVKGAVKINEARKEKGWAELKVHVVKLIEDTSKINQDNLTRLHEHKVSSSLLRVQRLGSIMRTPIPNESIPDKPYLIGLTGGVASGKSTIAKYLESLGFGYINYDLTAHKTYERIGSPVYNKIVESFGHEVVNELDHTINRTKLGGIVFSDKKELEKLNSIVWPAMYELVDVQLEQMKEKHDVIILESALLLESGQSKRVHQIWTTIIPKEEAIKRQMETRGLSHQEAEKRVNSQIDNLTRVKNSHVVFCTLWEPEFTKQQVNRALVELKEKFLIK